ncbi:MAG: hypothetical protein U0800_15220 [Isosphaeraceae bacterium]
MTSSPARPGPALGLLAAALLLATGCLPPSPAGPGPALVPPSNPPDPRDPLEVRPVEPRADDLAALLEELGASARFWDYDGPPCAVRIWVEVQDDRRGGPSEVVADANFDLIGPGARLYFILMPPASADEPPTAVFGTENYGVKDTARAALPALWHAEAADRTLASTVNSDPFSIEEAEGVPLVSFVSDLKEADAEGSAGGSPDGQRILLNARLSVLSAESP